MHRSLRSHLLYWNTTRDQSEGLFRGLSSNPYLPEGSKVGPPQSECIARFARTFSIGTPCATSPRGCFKGLLQTLICLRGPKLDLPRPSASLASLAPSLLEHHARPVRGVVSRANFKPSKFCTLLVLHTFEGGPTNMSILETNWFITVFIYNA